MTDPEGGADMVSVNEWRARKMNTEERSYDAVIFDLDGTLLDTLTDLADSLNAVLQLHDLPLHTKDEVRRFVGDGIRKLIERAIPGGTGHPQYEQIYQDFCTYYGEHCMDATEPYPGVPSLLDWLKEEPAVAPLCLRWLPSLPSLLVSQWDQVDARRLLEALARVCKI